MLDCIASEAQDITLRVLEPSCGNGNFLVEILGRRLAALANTELPIMEVEFAGLAALASLYGIDIDKMNVHECRERLKSRLEKFLLEIASSNRHEVLESADVILETNILCADALNGSTEILLVEYEAKEGGYFVREPSYLEDPEMDLFFAEPQPLKTVHYLELAK